MTPLLVQGNALALPLRDGCAQCIVTSPPYFGLRDYGTATWVGGAEDCLHSPADTPGKRGLATSTLHGGLWATGHQQEGYRGACPRCGATRADQQLGLERLHDCLAWARSEPPCGARCYICAMRVVFKECYRVLRDDGVLMINIADSYQDKQLCGIPQRLALALQADGWTWRQELIWHKLNPMPESVTDRCTKAHEQVLMFSKAPRYFWDGEAIKEEPQRQAQVGWKVSDLEKYSCDPRLEQQGTYKNWRKYCPTDVVVSRNARSVWSLASESYSGAHFATMPTALVERCIKAGTPHAGCCPSCRRPWARQVERLSFVRPKDYRRHAGESGHNNPTGTTPGSNTRGMPDSQPQTTGFAQACACPPAPAVPSIVLDPFSGSGTVPLVARALGRHGVGIELSGPYVALARDRLGFTALHAWAQGAPCPTSAYPDLPLFTIPQGGLP